jgi:hypothetical protein
VLDVYPPLPSVYLLQAVPCYPGYPGLEYDLKLKDSDGTFIHAAMTVAGF